MSSKLIQRSLIAPSYDFFALFSLRCSFPDPLRARELLTSTRQRHTVFNSLISCLNLRRRCATCFLFCFRSHIQKGCLRPSPISPDFETEKFIPFASLTLNLETKLKRASDSSMLIHSRTWSTAVTDFEVYVKTFLWIEARKQNWNLLRQIALFGPGAQLELPLQVKQKKMNPRKLTRLRIKACRIFPKGAWKNLMPAA